MKRKSNYLNQISIALFFTIVFISQSFGVEKPETKNQKQNVLFIFIDDLNIQLNCYGNETVQSPNIDKLADNSAMFTHAYCQWSVCGPSRASILCGQKCRRKQAFEIYRRSYGT